MFSLSELLNYDDFVIQCHNVPDADAIASAFAVYTYLTVNGKKAKIIYSGREAITKANLLQMLIKLSIPVEHVREMPGIKTLVLVDCQYGEKNVEKFRSDAVIVIDHHVDVKQENRLGIIRSQLGSCSTVVWDLLVKEGFELKNYPDVSTALYYGLFTDTNNFEEIANPLDKDMRDSLKFDRNIFKYLRYNNLTLTELNIAGKALTTYITDRGLSFAIFKAEPCDPNILGFISDLALQVNGIDVCVVYNELNNGYKMSIRSCIREVMANEFAVYLTEGVGSGGGHIQKAGGFIEKEKLDRLNTDINSYLEKHTREYYRSYDVIDAAGHSLDISKMKKYRKKKIPVGFAVSTDIFPDGTPVTIRTLEGDAETEASKDIFFMIGILGEVYPIKAERFNKSYVQHNGTFNTNFTYSPTVKNKITGDSVEIVRCAKPCLPAGDVCIYAMPARRNTKVFTAWNTESYMYGKPGDLIAVRTDNNNDVYIVRQDIFEQTYEAV